LAYQSRSSRQNQFSSTLVPRLPSSDMPIPLDSSFYCSKWLLNQKVMNAILRQLVFQQVATPCNQGNFELLPRGASHGSATMVKTLISAIIVTLYKFVICIFGPRETALGCWQTSLGTPGLGHAYFTSKTYFHKPNTKCLHASPMPRDSNTPAKTKCTTFAAETSYTRVNTSVLCICLHDPNPDLGK
jgi:hypothetical protein